MPWCGHNETSEDFDDENARQRQGRLFYGATGQRPQRHFRIIMMGKVLGIHIGENRLCCVAAGHRWRPHTSCTVLVTGDDLRQDDPLAAIAAQHSTAEVRVGLPVAAASLRYLRLPFSDPAKISSILPFELETTLPFEEQEIAVDFLPIQQDDAGCLVLAVAVRRQLLDQYGERLDRHRLSPAWYTLTPIPLLGLLCSRQLLAADSLCLFQEDNSLVLAGIRQGKICLLRSIPGRPAGDRLTREINNTLHVFYMQTGLRLRPSEIVLDGQEADRVRQLQETFDLPVRRLADILRQSVLFKTGQNGGSIETAIEACCAAVACVGSRQAGLRFRGGAGRGSRLPAVSRRDVAIAAGFLLVIATLWTAGSWLQYRHLQRRVEALDRRIAAVFHQALPEVTRIVDPVAQLDNAITAARDRKAMGPDVPGATRVLDVLFEISKQVPESPRITVQELTIDPQSMVLKGDAATFNAVDLLRNNLASLPVVASAEISAAGLDRAGQAVRFEMRLKRAGEQ